MNYFSLQTLLNFILLPISHKRFKISKLFEINREVRDGSEDNSEVFLTRWANYFTILCTYFYRRARQDRSDVLQDEVLPRLAVCPMGIILANNAHSSGSSEPTLRQG